MAFHEQPFATRFAEMGDEAESVFEEVCEVAFERYGLNRPSVKVNELPPFVRYTPDYITTRHLVEVQGFGSDNKVKFKSEKIHSMAEWHLIMPLQVFIYHRQTDAWCIVPFSELVGLLALHGESGEFHDGKQYTSLHKRHLAWTHR